MTFNSQRRLIVFLKYPEPGQVKTRLARLIGKEKAASIYRNLVEATFDSVTPLHSHEVDVTIAFEPPEKENEIKGWLPGPFEYFPQKGGDLGGRLREAARQAFSEGARQVILIGTDTPNLTSDEILEGFDLLEEHNAILGPAWDGGYYLIGMNSFEPALFQEISWSSPFVLQETVSKLKQLNWSYATLSLKRDVDYVEDLESFISSRRNS